MKKHCSHGVCVCVFKANSLERGTDKANIVWERESAGSWPLTEFYLLNASEEIESQIT